jgi:UDP-glucose 4-epimerase
LAYGENKMKILLTGSRGFIGSYFKKYYSDRYDIETFSFLHDNIDTLVLDEVDVIIHLAALVHQMHGASKDEYDAVNVENTLTLAKKAKASGVKHFIFMSSVKVYGEESDEVYSEDSPCNPQDDYGRSKLKAEKGLKKLEDSTFVLSIIRTPIVYGKGVKGNMEILVKLVKHIPIIPLGGIENRRSMVYIGNLCAIINRLIKRREPGVFLAADDRPVTTTSLIEGIAQALDKKVMLIKIPLFGFFIMKLKPDFYRRLYLNMEIDNQMTKERLEFDNPYTMQEGLKKMLMKDSKNENDR